MSRPADDLNLTSPTPLRMDNFRWGAQQNHDEAKEQKAKNENENPAHPTPTPGASPAGLVAVALKPESKEKTPE